MQRLILALCCAALLGFAGCNKPTEADCKSSCEHMYQLVATKKLGAASTKNKTTVKALLDDYIKKNDYHIKECVASCRRKGTRAAVTCIRSRKAYEDLQQCKGR